VAIVLAVPGARLSLIEFPADDPERARRFWAVLPGGPPRAQTRRGGLANTLSDPAGGLHARGGGPGDSFSLPYFAVDDLARVLEQVEAARRQRGPSGQRIGRLQGLRGKPIWVDAHGPRLTARASKLHPGSVSFSLPISF
jgi:hypothetical protein